jgi:lysophospholipase L1-like esterase
VFQQDLKPFKLIKHTIKNIMAAFLLLLVSCMAQAQPFATDIALFKKQDSTKFQPANGILFIGSSSFTKWTDVQTYFPSYPIINRGFGGSSLPDLIRYEKDIIFPYQPKQIVIYCGENDIAAADSVTAELVLERFTTLFNDIRKQWPRMPLVFISLKPSPARWAMRERMQRANHLIKKYLRKKKQTVFINVWDKMLGADGLPMADIFIVDKLHMNAKGYAIWRELIGPVLAK